MSNINFNENSVIKSMNVFMPVLANGKWRIKNLNSDSLSGNLIFDDYNTAALLSANKMGMRLKAAKDIWDMVGTCDDVSLNEELEELGIEPEQSNEFSSSNNKLMSVSEFEKNFIYDSNIDNSKSYREIFESYVKNYSITELSLQDLCLRSLGKDSYAADDAFEVLFIACSTLVRKYVAKKLNLKPNDGLYEDVVMAGQEGIYKAIRRYNPQMGAAFTSYVFFWIRSYAKREKHSLSHTVEIPNDKYTMYSKVLAFRTELDESDLSVAEKNKLIANKLNISVEELIDLDNTVGNFMKIISIDEDRGSSGDESFTLGDIIADSIHESTDAMAERKSIKEEIEKRLAFLTEREKKIVILHEGIECKKMSFAEIGKLENCSKENIRLIYNKAVEKMKHPIKEKKKRCDKK